MNKRRVLVVDDDVDFGESLGTFLEYAEFDVLVATSAGEALGLLATFLPDALVVDIHMPVVDGYALLAILRADPAVRGCEFIAMSADDQAAAHARATFDHFFVKPLNTSALVAVLNSP